MPNTEGNCPDSVISLFADGASAEEAFGPRHDAFLGFVRKLLSLNEVELARLIEDYDHDRYSAFSFRAAGLPDPADALLGYVSVELSSKAFPDDHHKRAALRGRI